MNSSIKSHVGHCLIAKNKDVLIFSKTDVRRFTKLSITSVDGDEEKVTDIEDQVDWFQPESGNNLATQCITLSCGL